jgi:hypothetical protein
MPPLFVNPPAKRLSGGVGSGLFTLPVHPAGIILLQWRHIRLSCGLRRSRTTWRSCCSAPGPVF